MIKAVPLKNIVSNSRLAQARCSNATGSVVTSAGSLIESTWTDKVIDLRLESRVTLHRYSVGVGDGLAKVTEEFREFSVCGNEISRIRIKGDKIRKLAKRRV